MLEHLWICLHWPFCPGVFISILAFMAAAVTFRKEPSMREKAVWIFVFLVLAASEIWMMGLDRWKHDKEENETQERQLKEYRDITDGLTKSIKQAQQHFDATMEQITGGSSYTYATVGITQHPPFQLFISVIGKTPVSAVRGTVQRVEPSHELPLSLPTGTEEFLPGTTPIQEQLSPGRYIIRILTRNGDITEQLDIAQCSNGQWNEAIKMNGAGAKENSRWKGIPGCHKPFN